MSPMTADPPKRTRGRRRKADQDKYTKKGANLNVWLPRELVEAFEALRREAKRTKTAEAQQMMEEYLEKHGRLPPRDSAM